MQSIKLLCLIIFLASTPWYFARSQGLEKRKIDKNKIDIGIFVGASYYLGEINTSRQFYSPQPSAGILLRKPFSSRYAVKGNLTVCKAHASDSDSKYEYQQKRDGSINTFLTELSGMFELNYLKFIEGSRRYYYTPYVTAGATFFYTPHTNHKFQFAIPFGIGFKYNLTESLNLVFDWTFRKTFTDDLDNLSGTNIDQMEEKQSAYYYSKDWYCLAGVSLTWKIRVKKNVCLNIGK